MKDYNNELHEIFTNILRGGVYGRTARGPRWAYFAEALYLINSSGDPFIGWNNYGSSANKCDLDNLLWIIKNIFKTTPREFLKEYECRF